MHRSCTGRHVSWFAGSLLLLLLTAAQCGGVIDSRPIADAGPDQDVNPGSQVNLDGSASNDADGDALTFAWSLESVPAGSAASLIAADTPTPRFTADVVGEYMATLTVSDGVLEANDGVSVIASANLAPVLSTIDDQSLFAGGSIEVAFTFADENPGTATVNATSSDQTLVADSDVQILGTGAARVVQIASTPLETGTAVITVMVRDSAGLEDAESFALELTQPFVAQRKITASDSASGDEFGTSVAIHGDHAVIGAPNHDGEGTASGSAYVFRRSGDEWLQSMRLPPEPLVVAATPSALSAGDGFGISVAISRDSVIVGAHLDDHNGADAGAAYVYQRCDSASAFCDQPWHEAAKLVASDGAADDRFGTSVAISGDYAVVGAYRDGSTAEGSAYVFERAGDDWIEMGKLIAGDAPAGEDFGGSVAIGGDYAIVGAFRDDLAGEGADTGSAYVFQRTGNDWVEVQKLTAGDAAAGDLFGFAVAISGDFAIISAVDGHAAYMFGRSDDDWVEVDKLTASAPVGHQSFGQSVAIRGDFAVVGAYRDNLTSQFQGSAYVFNRTGGTWTEIARLAAGDAAALDFFGYSVAIDGEYAMVGALADDLTAADEGSAYVFDR